LVEKWILKEKKKALLLLNILVEELKKLNH
jgi:hypothetical protein